MSSLRPETRGTGMTAFSSPTSYEEEEDVDDGMFSYLPPTTSQGGPASLGSFQRSVPGTASSPRVPLVPVMLRNTSTGAAVSVSDGSHPPLRDLEGSRVQPVNNSPTLDFAARPAEQMQRERLQGFRAGRAPGTAITAITTSSNGSPVIELNNRIKLARMSSSGSFNSDKVEDPKALVPPETGVSMTYSEALAHLQELDPEEEDSPYPEVRASVSNIDDPEMPALTFRVWLMGFILSICCGALNQFFSLRQPAPFLTPILVLIVAYPIGKVLAALLPTREYATPSALQRMGMAEQWSLNPGPFNVKEHAILVIMANTACAQDYALYLTLTLEKFYNIPKGPALDVILVLSNQLIGFAFAGFCRKYLVKPAALIWPQNLVFCTMFNTFHAEEDDGTDGSLTRFRFFKWVFVIAFFYWFLPGYLFTGLSYFTWICWIVPNNVVVNQVFGGLSGLGASALTFDWAQISYVGSPLVVPWWAEVNVFVGFAFFVWFLIPVFYYTNLWNTAYFPIYTSGVFDRFGNPYNVSQVLAGDGSVSLDLAAFEAYSPLYLPVAYIVVYSLAFCLSTAVITHVALYHGPDLWRAFRNARTQDEDVHAKLMRNYPEVPNWWYAIIMAICFALGVVAIEIYDTGLPVWGLCLALVIGAIYVVPSTYIYAQTALPVTVNVIAELIPGYLLPGRPIAVMLFKCFVVESLYSATNFVQDLKLGHYMKISPRTTFTVQLVAGISSSLVQIGIKWWLIDTVPDLCADDQGSRLTCPNQRVFFSTSIIWGVIGPARSFSPGALYHPLVYWTLIGALLPVPFWFLARRYPHSWIRYINIPVMLVGLNLIPAATGLQYSSWFITAFIFQFWVRRRFFRWWSKFNFVLSAALDAATILCGIVIFLCLQLPKNGSIQLNWWGNEVWQNTDDANGVPYLTAPADGF